MELAELVEDLERRVTKLELQDAFRLGAVKFIAVTTPIVLGVASFVTLLVRG